MYSTITTKPYFWVGYSLSILNKLIGLATCILLHYSILSKIILYITSLINMLHMYMGLKFKTS